MSFSDLYVMVTLALCFTPDEKEGILRKGREQTDGLLATNPHHIYQLGGVQCQNMTYTGTMKIE